MKAGVSHLWRKQRRAAEQVLFSPAGMMRMRTSQFPLRDKKATVKTAALASYPDRLFSFIPPNSRT